MLNRLNGEVNRFLPHSQSCSSDDDHGTPSINHMASNKHTALVLHSATKAIDFFYHSEKGMLRINKLAASLTKMGWLDDLKDFLFIWFINQRKENIIRDNSTCCVCYFMTPLRFCIVSADNHTQLHKVFATVMFLPGTMETADPCIKLYITIHPSCLL